MDAPARETDQQALLAEALARSDRIDVLELGAGAVARTGRVYRKVFGTAPACLIADENTFAACGAAVEAALRAEGITPRRHVLPARPRPKPTRELGDDLAALLADGEVPVAIGSGVLNDLVKYAAFARRRDYLCVATAASMDGYTSAGAPLSDRGFKKTLQCAPPRVIVADLGVIAAAPPEMIGWGFGDMAGKVPAGGDWLIADALGVEPLDDLAWPMVQDHLRGWLGDPDAVAAGAPDAVAGLFTGLAMVGLAMEFHGSSRPASGSDHQIAHLWEMDGLAQDGERVSHGACVSVGCMTILRLYDWLLDQPLDRLDPGPILAAAPDMDAKRREIAACFGAGDIADRAATETAAKHLDPAAHAARLETLGRVWPALRERLARHLLRADAVADLLKRAGAPFEAAQIGVDPAYHRRTVTAARFLRSRYTILDLLDETALLAPALDHVFGPEAPA